MLAAFTRLLYARGSFNFAEHLVLAAYTSGMRFLSFAVVVIPVWYLFRPGASTATHLLYAYFSLWPLYFGFAASQFFPGRRILSWCKGVAASILTWTSTQGLISLVGSVILSH